ncbi:MAG: CarD-like/TRCF domain protein [Lachnospiraceae bacterium]
MFEKKDIIFSETLGVCKVAEITRLPAKNNEQVLYYGLRSVYDSKKVSYIPVEHHQVLLRNLISYEEAKALEDDYENLTKQQQMEVEYVLANYKN